MRCAIKPYASCRDTHAAVDAVGRILDRCAIPTDEITAVHVRLNPFLAGTVGGRDASSLAASQMSLPYAIAARIVYGTAGLSAYAPERRVNPRLRALMQQVVIDVDESVTGSDQASVSVLSRDEVRIHEPTATARGAPENPLQDHELLAKFYELASYSVPVWQARELGQVTLALDEVTDARRLLNLLRRER